MTTYQKIPGPFWRDPATNQLTEQWSCPEFSHLQDTPWIWTEKVDGTNVRIIWDGHRVSFAGRSDNASFPMPLYEYLVARYGGPDNETLFEQKFGDSPVVLYGEGFGPKIQGGGKYRSDVSVALFDVRVGKWWLTRIDVENVAGYFGVPSVPVYSSGLSLRRAVDLLRNHELKSAYGDFEPEGLVGTTTPGLFNRAGERIIVKLKTRDLNPRKGK